MEMPVVFGPLAFWLLKVDVLWFVFVVLWFVEMPAVLRPLAF